MRGDEEPVGADGASEAPYTPTDAEAESPERVIERVKKFAVAGYVLIAIPTLFLAGWRAFIGLTCSAAVVMINFLWLEGIVRKTLQPAPQVKAWRLAVRTLARFALFGAALTIAIFVVRFNTLSVLLGFSIIVIGIMGEAAYTLQRTLRRTDNR